MLTNQQRRDFEEQGFVTLPGLFDEGELAVLRKETERILALERPEVLRHEDGAPRAALALQRYSEVSRRLLHHPKLLEPAQDLLGEPFYLHQYKIVTKHPFGKLALPWHQDYASWADIDGMPQPRAITIGLYMEDVTEFNGALAFIPGSHKHAILDDKVEFWPGKTVKTITLGPESLAPLVKARGIVAPKGPAGTAVIFDSLLAHGSGPNMSPFWRHIVYVSPNPVSNRLADPKRDEMFAHRDYSPMTVEPALDMARAFA